MITHSLYLSYNYIYYTIVIDICYNIDYILLVLGITATINPIHIPHNTIWKEIPFTLLGAVIVTIFGIREQIDGFALNSINLNSTDTIYL